MNENTHVDDPLVAAILTAAAAPAEGPVPGEAQALAAFRRAHRRPRRLFMFNPKENLKLFAAALFGGVVMISGAATAATGGLPIVSHHNNTHATSHTPDADDDQGEDVDTDTDADEGTEVETDAVTPDSDSGPNGDHGALVSAAAHADGHTGASVCAVASENKCTEGRAHGQADADTHGQADAEHGNAGTHSQAGTKGAAGKASAELKAAAGKAHSQASTHRHTTPTP